MERLTSAFKEELNMDRGDISKRNVSRLKLANLAFMNIDKVKKGREIPVTKVVSWLLRALVKHHRRSRNVPE